MKRALPVLVLSIAGLVPVWRYAPSPEAVTAPAASSEASVAPAAPSGGSTVAAGPVVGTEKGPVQVEVTFEERRITAVRMLQQPDHPQTTAAVPRLIEKTLDAQSADVDTVSGATITSDGYRESLQAAIDAQAAQGAGA
ncbi:FMN-binding protein [Streptomyces sp. CT1-17]|uniref:FMN-binding protein n=1 Tax=Streptomyces sp. CT1-17 TaxID=2885642 RepID=UPI001D104744|nr:FMN-binding protein [Streptomyces sp. CT1-17]MCC2266427.1 FMN-binding protein [Streptomyces sp. CT1-17]